MTSNSSPVADVAAKTGEPAGEDRRTATRVSFAARIGVYEGADHPAPREADFTPVTARDLSQTGIAFRTNRWPRSDQLIVCFTESDRPRRVVARVVECQREDTEGGDTCYDVRCEFRRWLS